MKNIIHEKRLKAVKIFRLKMWSFIKRNTKIVKMYEWMPPRRTSVLLTFSICLMFTPLSPSPTMPCLGLNSS